MRRRIKCYLALAGLLALPAPAIAGDFDYYLLALTWTPSFCALEATGRDREQCDAGRPLGFTLHGLWPQYEHGWPEFCDSTAEDPSRRETAAMADIMGSGGLAWHQWKKHGRCTGLSAERYFQAAREAYYAVVLPPVAGGPIAKTVLERAFMAGNAELDPGEMVVTCRDGHVREVRICLDRALEPRRCGADVLRAACRTAGDLRMPPVR